MLNRSRQLSMVSTGSDRLVFAGSKAVSATLFREPWRLISPDFERNRDGSAAQRFGEIFPGRRSAAVTLTVSMVLPRGLSPGAVSDCRFVKKRGNQNEIFSTARLSSANALFPVKERVSGRSWPTLTV